MEARTALLIDLDNLLIEDGRSLTCTEAQEVIGSMLTKVGPVDFTITAAPARTLSRCAPALAHHGLTCTVVALEKDAADVRLLEEAAWLVSRGADHFFVASGDHAFATLALTHPTSVVVRTGQPVARVLEAAAVDIIRVSHRPEVLAVSPASDVVGAASGLIVHQECPASRSSFAETRSLGDETGRRGHGTSGSLLAHLRSNLRRLGGSAVEKLLLAYFVAADDETPAWARAHLVGALMYFGLPVDAIPDVIPVAGFTDDVALLASALTAVTVCIRPRHVRRARSRMRAWGLLGAATE